MGISSLGVGSSVLTQDVLDQLRAADEAQYITPVDRKISAEKSKTGALNVIDALMDNVYGSLKGLTEYGVFESRTTSSSDESVATVVAADSSDIQNFSLEVDHLATKEIEQSGAFLTEDAAIADGPGKLKLTVGTKDYIISYDASTKLTDLKKLINEAAGESVDATIVQVASDNFRLMLSADATGTGQAISITDVAGAGEHLDTALTTGMSNVQTAVDAGFKFNGLDIIRQSNTVDDLLSGVTITLLDAGTTNVTVKQDRENIESKITNFIDKYNSAVFQLDKDTKSSQKVEERGVFSGDSTIKSMKRSIENILNTIGGGVGRMQDYGIEIDDDGRLSLDSSVLNAKLDEDPDNVQAFLAGGVFNKPTGGSVEVDGIFGELESEFAKYSKYGAILDDYRNTMEDKIDTLTKQRTEAIERLDARYETLKKQWGAYDLMISKINSASQMFVEMANTMTNAQNNLK